MDTKYALFFIMTVVIRIIRTNLSNCLIQKEGEI